MSSICLNGVEISRKHTRSALVWAKNRAVENWPLNTWPLRCGSMINTNRFPKRGRKGQAFKGVYGHAPQGNFKV